MPFYFFYWSSTAIAGAYLTEKCATAKEDEIETIIEPVRRSIPGSDPAFSLRRGSRLVAKFVKHFNTVRSQIAIAYITPPDKLGGRGRDLRRPATEAGDRQHQT